VGEGTAVAIFALAVLLEVLAEHCLVVVSVGPLVLIPPLSSLVASLVVWFLVGFVGHWLKDINMI
jgi:fructose-specific phosphotransferase system IIC component